MRTRLQSTRIVENKAGCYTCHGGNTEWTAANAKALAAQHHDKTGHRTWAQNTSRTEYGSGARPGNNQGALI